MDRTKNRLALVGELPQEPDDIPRALTVQSGRRFVQEQKELRLRGEFDTNRKALASFDVQRHDDRIGQKLKLQELDDLLDVCVLLLLWNVVWLPQVSGEPHRLTDSSRAFVHIHLLGVGGSASEVPTKRPPIDEEITVDDTDIFPLSKDIKTSGLPGARGAHERRHRPGPDITVNLMEESKVSARDGDSVIDAFPSKGLAVSEGNLLLDLGSLLFYELGSPLLLAESSVEFGSLFGLLGEDGETNTIIRGTLETRLLLGTGTERARSPQSDPPGGTQ